MLPLPLRYPTISTLLCYSVNLNGKIRILLRFVRRLKLVCLTKPLGETVIKGKQEWCLPYHERHENVNVVMQSLPHNSHQAQISRRITGSKDSYHSTTASSESGK